MKEREIDESHRGCKAMKILHNTLHLSKPHSTSNTYSGLYCDCRPWVTVTYHCRGINGSTCATLLADAEDETGRMCRTEGTREITVISFFLNQKLLRYIFVDI